MARWPHQGQRSRWAPSAALRQLSMAWSTRRCSHISQDWFSPTKLSSCCRTISTTSEGGRLTASVSSTRVSRCPDWEDLADPGGSPPTSGVFAKHPGRRRCVRVSHGRAAPRWRVDPLRLRASANSWSTAGQPASFPWHTHCWLAFDAPRDDSDQKVRDYGLCESSHSLACFICGRLLSACCQEARKSP